MRPIVISRKECLFKTFSFVQSRRLTHIKITYAGNFSYNILAETES